MRDPSASLAPTARWGLSNVGACQSSAFSVPPPPALVGLYSVWVAACATPAWVRSWRAKGAVRPRPAIRRTKARREIPPALTAATSSRSSCSVIATYQRPSCVAVPVLQVPEGVVTAAQGRSEVFRPPRHSRPVDHRDDRMILDHHVVHLNEQRGPFHRIELGFRGVEGVVIGL